MLGLILGKVFGTRNDRLLKNYRIISKQVNELELNISKMTDEELKSASLKLRERVKSGETLEDVKIEAFALCREVSRRVMGMRHFDVQIIGGLSLNDGKIAEMRTGEGKTLVATLAAYLNALSGDGVHIITVNDYLAERDANIMRPLYEALGLKVGFNISRLNHYEKRQMYDCDIIYGTNSEFGFDYLRNNLVLDLSERTQKKLNFAIIDEVDSILIDEARTPLIISEAEDEPSDLFISMNKFIKGLVREFKEDDGGDFSIEEEKRQVYITDLGYKKIEKELKDVGLIENHSDMYHDIGLKYLHYINNALRANFLYFINQQYIVKDGEVIIVDEFTGRLADGRRWSDGLHQAIEAKENVEIKKESRTLATITYQNFFLLYKKLSGMTGTAATESHEFFSIYNLETIIIPTNKAIKRKDHIDIIYPRLDDKLNAIVKEIKLSHEKGQPVLVGTSSIESSEIVAEMLKKEGMEHKILNAKYHELEADIIAQAGKFKSVTIATNMAGRGTDIILGGNISSTLKYIKETPDIEESDKEIMLRQLKTAWDEDNKKVIEAGGLKVIGFEKNEARRIDNQLRGRSGRQGDIGESVFFLSLEDELFRIFGGDKFKNLVNSLKLEPDAQLQNRFINKLLNDAQVKLEGSNFNIRKSLIDFDMILNQQRKKFYELRNSILEDEDVYPYLLDMFEFLTNDILQTNNVIKDVLQEQWNFKELKVIIHSLKLEEIITEDVFKNWQDNDLSIEQVKDALFQSITETYLDKVATLEKSSKSYVEKSTILSRMDKYWQAHLTNMERVKDFIHLRAYAQKDPKQEYKKEAHEGFVQMFELMKIEIAEFLLKTEFIIHSDEESEIVNYKEDSQESIKENIEKDTEDKQLHINYTFNSGASISRNDLCHCGSGLKYKNCHGKLN